MTKERMCKMAWRCGSGRKERLSRGSTEEPSKRLWEQKKGEASSGNFVVTAGVG